MTELEQIKKIIEKRLKEHISAVDDERDDLALAGMIHEDRVILREIEEIMKSRDKIESDN